MTTKPTLDRVWASNASAGNVVDPDTVTAGKFENGWVAEVPPFQYFNFIQQLFSQALLHFNEYGIGEHDNDTIYPLGGLASVGGSVYRSNTANNQGNDPVSSGTWDLFLSLAINIDKNAPSGAVRIDSSGSASVTNGGLTVGSPSAGTARVFVSGSDSATFNPSATGPQSHSATTHVDNTSGVTNSFAQLVLDHSADGAFTRLASTNSGPGSCRFTITTSSSNVEGSRYEIDSAGRHNFYGNVGAGGPANVNNAFSVDGDSAGAVAVIANPSNNILITASGAQVIALGANSANSALYVNRDSATSRSINASGTINASGADYAEYVRKNPTCGAIQKGDVIGFDKHGEITNKFAESISFAVKSTDPNLVGGDTWAITEKPKLLEPDNIEYTGVARPDSDTESEDFKTYNSDVSAHNSKIAEEKKRVDAINREALAEWEVQHEKERGAVDRVAFCGVVPVNFSGEYSVGDFLIAKDNGSGGITVLAKTDYESFADIKNCVGRVKSVGEDGRPHIIVKIVG